MSEDKVYYPIGGEPPKEKTPKKRPVPLHSRCHKKIKQLTTKVQELKAENIALKVENTELKGKLYNDNFKPEEDDIIGLFIILNEEISPGYQRKWKEFWQDVIYANRHHKIGLTQKEMVNKLKNMNHTWGKEPVRKAVKKLLEHDLLIPNKTRYIINLNYVEDLCQSGKP
ncbi:MAG: hypothetical protein KAR56_01910 [Thermoplasmata archaeon]|nr:hypothetical protein [Thermoplasmata archaeon]